MFNLLWRLISGNRKTPAQSESLDETRVDNQEREAVVPNRRKVPAKKGNTSAKPTRVRSDNKSKAGGKSTGKAVRAPATKSKSKSKAV